MVCLPTFTKMGIVIVFAVTSILKVVCPLCFAFQICSGIVLFFNHANFWHTETAWFQQYRS